MGRREGGGAGASARVMREFVFIIFFEAANSIRVASALNAPRQRMHLNEVVNLHSAFSRGELNRLRSRKNAGRERRAATFARVTFCIEENGPGTQEGSRVAEVWARVGRIARVQNTSLPSVPRAEDSMQTDSSWLLD